MAAAGGRQVSALFMSFMTYMSFMFMLLAPDQTRHANTPPRGLPASRYKADTRSEYPE